MGKGRLLYIPADLLEEINKRKTPGLRNSVIMRELALDAKIGKDVKRMMNFWGIYVPGTRKRP
jgi:hypothetical protein